MEEVIKSHSLYGKSIFIKSVVPQRKIVETVAQADISIMLPVIGDSVSHDFSLPNKFFESLMARVPFISTNIPSVSNIINEYGIGGVVDDHNDFDSIYKLSFKVISNRINDIKPFNNAAQHFCWENQEKNYVSYLRTLFVGLIENVRYCWNINKL